MNLCKTRRQQAAESTGKWCSAVEECDAEHHLVTSVEHGEVHQHATKQTSFSKTQEESRDQQSSVAFDEAGAHRDQPPGYQ
jgi:hypothetical protein